MTAPGGGTWQTARRILAVRLDAMGDVLMTTPALRALAGEHGVREVTLLTSPAGADVAALLPMLSDVIVHEAAWMKATAPRPEPDAELALIERLRERTFDAAVVFTVFSQNPLPAALICYLAGIPLRAAHCHENPYQLLTDWVPDPEPATLVRHEVRRQLDLVAGLGFTAVDERLSMEVLPGAVAHVHALLAAAGIAAASSSGHTGGLEQPWAVIHPGASAPSRRYRAEGFAEAAGRLVAEHGWRVVFTGSADEVALVESIRAAMGAPSASLAGQLDLAELAALLSIAPVLISNNTGPVHVAAAVGTPVVDLYALTNPQHTPWGVPSRVLNHDVPCRDCYKSVCPMGHHDCLRLVPPSAIVTSAQELLAARRDARTPGVPIPEPVLA